LTINPFDGDNGNLARDSRCTACPIGSDAARVLLPLSSCADFFKNMKGNNRSTSYSLAEGPPE
jgi:hypothetical protein